MFTFPPPQLYWSCQPALYTFTLFSHCKKKNAKPIILFPWSLLYKQPFIGQIFLSSKKHNWAYRQKLLTRTLVLFLVLLFPVQVFTDSKDISLDCLISIICSFSHVSVRLGFSYRQWQILRDLNSKTINCIHTFCLAILGLCTVTGFTFNSHQRLQLNFLPIQQQQKNLTLFSVYRFLVLLHN